MAPLLGSVSWMFLFMPILAVGRGYYQGTFNMTPTAISQVTEQFIRVTVIILVALLAVHRHWTVYRMGTWAMFASTFGAIVPVSVLFRFIPRSFGKQSNQPVKATLT